MKKDFFPEKPDNNPKVYAYTENTPEYKDLIKIGYTARSLDERMKEHYPTKGPNNIKRYEVLLLESSMRNDGSYFLDKDVHKVLINNGYKNVGGEWFNCKVNHVKSAIISLKENVKFDIKRNKNFDLRPEQKDAVNKTSKYFKNYNSIEKKTPHFLWNCKMRFGKTFATYELAKKMKWNKILILTFKPAVENSWREDLYSHINYKEWQFISKDTNSYNDIDKSKPFACFASFQDFLGKNKDFLECIIYETHHIEKVDLPSGTAIELKEIIENNNKGNLVISIDIESKRISNVNGIHEIRFSNNKDLITFKHEALSRNIFSDGAIAIAKSIIKKEPNLYTTKDFFN